MLWDKLLVAEAEHKHPALTVNLRHRTATSLLTRRQGQATADEEGLLP